jgi:hypothetical protein
MGRWSVPGSVILGLCTALAVLPAVPAGADTAPTPPTPPTVSADLLPAPQINGVAWAQVVSGNRVYVAGKFTRARPYGSPAGTNEVVRNNMLAYDLTTGALSSWAPSLNAQGLGIAASPDGARIYVTGEFTQVSGVNRYRVAALDAATGALISTWAPALNYRARPIVVTADTVYVGGAFSTAANQPRQRVAAFATSNGALKPFTVTNDGEIFGLALPPGSNRLVLGGRFTVVNGVATYGLGAVNPTTGASLAMPANQVVRDAGPDAAIYSLSFDSSQVYGSGYVYGSGGNLEGTFAASATTGALNWVNGCMGDTYGTAPAGGDLYSVGHAHNCGMIGFFPEQPTRAYQYAIASTTTPAADGRKNTTGPFTGKPAAEPLHWLPTLTPGSFTGQTQAAWTVTGNSSYVLLGGEFPTVNNVAQQGLARFAVSSIAPNKQGPLSSSALTPTLSGAGTGAVKAVWTSTWDRDNRRLTYELLRGSTVVATVSGNSAWWSKPQLTATDTTAPPGTVQSYRIRVHDAFTNTLYSGTASITVPS